MKKIYLCGIAVLALAASSCDDSFLDKAPQTTATEPTVFASVSSVKAYMWPSYQSLYTSGIGTSTVPATTDNVWNAAYYSDWSAGYLSHKNTANRYAMQTKTTASSGNGWDFGYINRANIAVRGLEASSTLLPAEKNHWKAVAYFFHSWWYMELIDRFGDVPYINKTIDGSSPETYGSRLDRKIVADSVLNRLKWAEANIGDASDGDNTINKACIQMAISRFTLREGTWRKYHNLGDYTAMLQECVRASQEVMNAYPGALYTGTDGQPAAGYGEMFTSPSLAGVKGVILYHQYLTGAATHNLSFKEKNDQAHMQLTQDMVDMYLTKNGLPIANSANTQYEGASHDIYDVFRNRDPRLYHTVTPPYVVVSGGANKPAGYPSCKWGYNANAKFREYMDIMGINAECGNGNATMAGHMKRLPLTNWNGGTIIWKAPNLKGVQGPCCTSSGYYIWKNYNDWDLNDNNANYSEADKPIFKVEEALLNYAEAKCELNTLTQNDIDISINLLRDRAGVDHMTLSAIDANFDPNRDKGNNAWWTTGDLGSSMPDYEVPPVLWEVRRERIIELMGEGFGFYDVRRWAKAPYFINRQEKGMYWKKGVAPYGTQGSGVLNESTGLKDAALTEGYIFVNDSPKVLGKGWLDQYYLYCIPLEDLTLNKNLTQNPGWQKAAE